MCPPGGIGVKGPLFAQRMQVIPLLIPLSQILCEEIGLSDG